MDNNHSVKRCEVDRFILFYYEITCSYVVCSIILTMYHACMPDHFSTFDTHKKVKRQAAMLIVYCDQLWVSQVITVTSPTH